MSRSAFLRLALPFLLLLAPASLRAQETAPLQEFVQRVVQLWTGGDAAALVRLAPAGTKLLLDTGSGTEAVDARHAAAALRELFGARENVSVRPARVTMAGGRPPRGFGEIAWSFRERGGPVAQTRSVYVGTVWEDDGWRITELRIIP